MCGEMVCVVCWGGSVRGRQMIKLNFWNSILINDSKKN